MITSRDLGTFVEEAQMLRFLVYPNVVRFNGIYFEEEKNQYWMVMEFMEYGSLVRFLAKYDEEKRKKEPWNIMLIRM